MALEKNNLRFTWRDVEDWVAQGLLAPQQADAILQHVVASGQGAEPAEVAQQQGKHLHLLNIIYYFGAFMILLAYTIFVGVQWEDLGRAGQVAIAGVTIGILWGLGFWLRRGSAAVAGDLLVFVGAGIVPLLVYTVQRLTGLWPDTSYETYNDFYREIRSSWVVMELISIGVALAVLRFTRFPPIMLLVSFWTWFLSMDLVRLLTDSSDWSWGTPERVVSTLLGVGMLAVGVVLQRRTRKDYSFWLYLFGHLIILSHLGSLTLEYENALGLVYIAVYLAFVVASVWLQRQVFLVFGAIGCYSYLCYLAFEVFDSALGFTFGLAAIGLLIVLTAVGYQKYARVWLERWVGSKRIVAERSAA